VAVAVDGSGSGDGGGFLNGGNRSSIEGDV
jgi:hypothetical protein